MGILLDPPGLPGWEKGSKIMEKKIIDIIIPSSDKYLPYVSALMVSALENINDNYRLSFHILTEDIKQETIRKNELLSRNYDFDIEYKYIDSSSNFELPFCIKTHIDSKIVYAKLIISSLFPQLDRAIILEGDMIVTGDLSELWNIDISNYAIAATKDAWYKCRPNFEKEPYFNTGMFYAHLTKWREMEFEKKVAETIPTIELRFPDQDLFNAILRNSVMIIDWCWNSATCVYESWFNCLNEDEKKQMLENHKILHYIHQEKPWQSYTSRCCEYFWYYARLTPFYEKLLLPKITIPTKYVEYDDLIAVLNYRKNILQYWRCKIMYMLSKGKKKEHYLRKKENLKKDIRQVKKLLKRDKNVK